MGTLHFLPSPDRARIPTPISFAPGAKYLLVEMIHYDAPLMLGAQAKLIFRLGSSVSGSFHAIRTPNGTAVSLLLFLEDGALFAQPAHEGAPSGLYKLRDLDILGAVEEIYPHGWEGGFWCWFTSRESVPYQAELPLLSAH